MMSLSYMPARSGAESSLEGGNNLQSIIRVLSLSMQGVCHSPDVPQIQEDPEKTHKQKQTHRRSSSDPSLIARDSEIYGGCLRELEESKGGFQAADGGMEFLLADVD